MATLCSALNARTQVNIEQLVFFILNILNILNIIDHYRRLVLVLVQVILVAAGYRSAVLVPCESLRQPSVLALDPRIRSV